jgi:hypothetical protein
VKERAVLGEELDGQAVKFGSLFLWETPILAYTVPYLEAGFKVKLSQGIDVTGKREKRSMLDRDRIILRRTQRARQESIFLVVHMTPSLIKIS